MIFQGRWNPDGKGKRAIPEEHRAWSKRIKSATLLVFLYSALIGVAVTAALVALPEWKV